MDRAKFLAMTEEEQKEASMDALSDAVRDAAHRLMMLRALANTHNGIDPEDFDKAFEKECSKEWDKVKDKSSSELALMGMLEMMAGGMSIEEVFGESEEE
jgi:hypothetical protein